MMKAQKIYIIHGWTYTLDKWQQCIHELTTLGYEPVMLHVPGLSEPSDEVWDVAKYVEWLHEKIGNDKNVIVVGHSNGGRIAMAYDVKHPKKIKRLILESSAGIYHDDLRTQAKRKVMRNVSKVLKYVARGKLRRVLYRLAGASDYGNAKPNMKKTMANVINHDKTFDPMQVSAHTSFIWGNEDKVTPLEDGQALHSLVKNPGSFHIVAGAGHSPHGTQPTKVAQLIDTIIVGEK